MDGQTERLMWEWLAVNFEVLDVFVMALACSRNSCPVAAHEPVDQIVTVALFEVDFGEDIEFAVDCSTRDPY